MLQLGGGAPIYVRVSKQKAGILTSSLGW